MICSDWYYNDTPRDLSKYTFSAYRVLASVGPNASDINRHVHIVVGNRLTTVTAWAQVKLKNLSFMSLESVHFDRSIGRLAQWSLNPKREWLYDPDGTVFANTGTLQFWCTPCPQNLVKFNKRGYSILDTGLSENRVYSQWNSHLIGIMIINHWV